ncbi:MAG: hypothetical protein MRZ74_06105 [Blautia sp.]|nr:hypothetical protein [Blautia sp.]MDY5031884.1 hypothetical protein [Blautia sp.]
MEHFIGLVIYLAVASFMTGIGISQLRSKKPVAFYSNEKPPKEEELSDVKAWNQKHGRMWVLYGFIILVSYGTGVIIGDSLWSVIPMCGGVMLPLPIMVLYHHKLLRLYRKS